MAQQIKKKFLAPEVIDYFDNQISAEESARIAADSSLQSLIESEVSTLEAADSAETSARIAGDASLQSQIDNIISNIDPAALDSLTEIVSAFQAADNDFNSAISSLTESNNSNLAAEESARIAADSSLQSLIESEVSTLEAADSVIDFRLDILEAKGFSKGYKIIEEELSYIDLDKKYENILFMSVGRLAVHENEDYVLSVIEGITRVTWIGSLASPDGEEKIELGDKVFWCGNF